jgi:acyl carrier protein
MTDTEIRDAVLRVLGRIAQEVGASELPPDEPLRDAADLDSVDFLNFVVGLHDELGVEVPERDYAELATLDGCVAYLARHGAAAGGRPSGA